MPRTAAGNGTGGESIWGGEFPDEISRWGLKQPINRAIDQRCTRAHDSLAPGVWQRLADTHVDFARGHGKAASKCLLLLQNLHWMYEILHNCRNLRHDRPFTLSMANAGPNTNGSQVGAPAGLPFCLWDLGRWLRLPPG